MKKNAKIILLAFLVTFVWVLPGYEESMSIIADFTPKMTMVIDPGHGGPDSGACAKDGTMEKDINLAISRFLAEEALRYRVSVVMTREEDCGLYEKGGKSGSGGFDTGTLGAEKWSKIGDLRERRRIIDEADAGLAVSVHLNSFVSDQGVHGAQVFYPVNGLAGTRESNKKMAEAVKASLHQALAGDGDRIILPKKDMFIFQDAACAGLLVECGFLSSPSDLEKLKDSAYQKKLAAAIMRGIASARKLSPASPQNQR